MKLKNLTHKLAAGVSTFAITMSSADVLAQDNLGNVVVNIRESASPIPGFISTLAYICGIALGATGVYKLKQHVDDPNQEPMKGGLVRLAAGGGLLALPYMTSAMTGTVGEDGTGVEFKDVNTFSDDFG